ncbi:hypothetical protein [Porphyromonas levii]|uniref:Uncharacterized protein n=1 Tax=Porphyromonas levii TaxID=28114 RepID=A0A4Y8WQK9_9PORP|nr:hypothetical protein [Porphyromonas levii]MBR8703745.1 hypothetical protein [Porphyromonas levii]MBR8713868.1 hypothetical protein [Porphyromonas levii]MBR8715867.1 hypothetical protein [Porphyromonas levii]MBR8728426.1 hypothetical protein [Porphyromonas levii]MBR8729602.1 hypothetical protein [Porphyromonas levii]
MLETLLVTLAVVAICVMLLGFRVFFTKKWSFPNSHVEGQPKLEEQGITCHRHQHKDAQRHRNLFDRIRQEERLQ